MCFADIVPAVRNLRTEKGCRISMKKNKIYHGYHHEDLTLKFLKENTTKYIAKITGAEFCDEINVELINLKPKVLRIDYGIKKKDKIILYEFLSTKSNIANILRRIFLYVARIGYDYQLKVKINLVVTLEIDKNQVVLGSFLDLK